MAIFTFEINRFGKSYLSNAPTTIVVDAPSAAVARARAENKYRSPRKLAASVALSAKLVGVQADPPPQPHGEITADQLLALSDLFWVRTFASLAQEFANDRYRLVRDFCLAGGPTLAPDPVLGRYISVEFRVTTASLVNLLRQVSEGMPATITQNQYDDLVGIMEGTWLAEHVPTCEYKYQIEVWNGTDWKTAHEFEPSNPVYPVGHAKHRSVVRT